MRTLPALPAVMFLTLLSASGAHALENFDPGNLSDLSQGAVDSLIKTTAIGASHRAYMPASPLGYAIGLDLGLDVTAIVLPDEFKNALAAASDSNASEIPAVIPIPKLNLHKGLPGGVDLGFTFTSYQDILRSYGVDVKWAFLDGKGAGPSAAARVSGNYSKIYFITSRAWSFDALASLNLKVLEPYAGAGLQLWSGDLSYDVSQPGFAANVSGHQSGSDIHFFAGLPLKLLALRITAEIDHSLAGLTTYGAKLGFSF